MLFNYVSLHFKHKYKSSYRYKKWQIAAYCVDYYCFYNNNKLSDYSHILNETGPKSPATPSPLYGVGIV